MKIKEIKINKFKRFTDLTITNIPSTIKLVILVGPNGCGKTSIFEALNHWYKFKGFNQAGNLNYYVKTSDQGFIEERHWWVNRVNITFHDAIINSNEDAQGKFYFRTAHRNEPDFTAQGLSRQVEPQKHIKFETLMSTDMSVSENYQRLLSNTLSGVFNANNENRLVKDLRDELIGKIKVSLNNVFNDLQLSSIGNPLIDGSFYFDKGRSHNFHYRNLSAGEKSAFDLILDFVVKSSYFNNTVYCIDEPEAHMHTALQAKLLEELYNLTSDNSQLWISTHSIGMLQKAKELEEVYPNTVCFINFTDVDFDSPAILQPTSINANIWNKFLELTFGDFSKLIAPSRVVFCEGTIKGRAYKNFDAQIYSKIFCNKYPETSFVSIGSCKDLENPDNISMKIISQVLNNSTIIKIVDRDDKSETEIQELEEQGIRVLSKRHIECYLLDDELLTKLCVQLGKSDKIEECLSIKQTAISNSISRGNPSDDIKSARGEIYTKIKQLLSLTQCGNTVDAFLRDTIAPLMTPDLQIFQLLESELFG